MENHFTRSANLISIDTEGTECELLATFDFARYRPEIFCVETVPYLLERIATKSSDTLELMKINDYFTKTGLQEIPGGSRIANAALVNSAIKILSHLNHFAQDWPMLCTEDSASATVELGSNQTGDYQRYSLIEIILKRILHSLVPLGSMGISPEVSEDKWYGFAL